MTLEEADTDFESRLRETLVLSVNSTESEGRVAPMPRGRGFRSGPRLPGPRGPRGKATVHVRDYVTADWLPLRTRDLEQDTHPQPRSPASCRFRSGQHLTSLSPEFGQTGVHRHLGQGTGAASV